MHPEFDFQTDVIYELRENLDEYPEHYAVGTSFGCLMVNKTYMNLIGGYDEAFASREGCEENLCRRLELVGIHKLFIPIATLRRECSRLYKAWQTNIPNEILTEMLLPIHLKASSVDYSNDSGIVLYDSKEYPYAKEQCEEYLSGLKQFDISTNEVFDKIYPLVALIPTYNESERIMDCLRSVEMHCDGIILLDDDSIDDTYEIVQSEKLLLKAKKIRTEFNDKHNRNILLDLASFFKVEWFIFIDADERFDDRFVDLREIMKRQDVDTVGVWVANLWDSMDMYRTDMEDTNPYSKNGLWFRWRMFRNKGRMQITVNRSLHFSSVPYRKEYKSWKSKSLLLHLGYIDNNRRMNKYNFYKKEDCSKVLNYDDIIYERCQLLNIHEITSTCFEI